MGDRLSLSSLVSEAIFILGRFTVGKLQLGLLATFMVSAGNLHAQTQTVIGEGLTGQALLDYVVANYKPSTTLGYDRARDTLYKVIDLQSGNLLTCIYTGFSITLNTELDPSTDAANKGINCEHSWPQSKGADAEPQQSDMHHLYPVKDNVNSSRGNNPYMEILDANADVWFRNAVYQYTMPTSNLEEWAEKENNTPTGFEPRHASKGNVARSTFYFFAMYQAAADTNFWNQEKDVAYLWHYADPVDQDEYNRSYRIAAYQNNKPNPFVLDSTLARRIWFSGGGGTTPPPPAEPTMTEVLVPQYMQGISGTNNKRIPYACLVKFSGLNAGATYRYVNQIVISTDASTADGAGNCIFPTVSGNFIRSSSVSLSTSGGYGEFTTDENGEYTGWMITESTGNSRFAPANTVYMRIRINNGAGGTTVTQRFTTTSGITIINFGTSSSYGTGLRGISNADPKTFIALYDNVNGTGRPVAATFVESDGTSNTTAESYVTFYSSNVNGNNGAWGTIIPNTLSSGIRRIERRATNPGTLLTVATDADGVWPSGCNTVNPSSGETALLLTAEDNSLPITLTDFSANTVASVVLLTWVTESEIENQGFNLYRKLLGGEYALLSSFLDNSALVGQGTTTQKHVYDYFDRAVQPGATYVYQLADVDYAGQETKHKEVEVKVEAENKGLVGDYRLRKAYPNPFNASFTIPLELGVSLPVDVRLYDVSGACVRTISNEVLSAGTYHLTTDTRDLPSGIYLLRMRVGNQTETQKIVLMK